jgi:septal ring factor EnvC (AmiA/AmiB activator)
MYFNSDKWYEDHINEQQQIIDQITTELEELKRPANEIKAKLKSVQQEIETLKKQRDMKKNPSSKEIDKAVSNLLKATEGKDPNEKVRVNKKDYDTLFNIEYSDEVNNMSDDELCSTLEKFAKENNMTLEQIDKLSMREFDKLLKKYR